MFETFETLHFNCKGHGFDPWLGNEDPACFIVRPKIIKIIFQKSLKNCGLYVHFVSTFKKRLRDFV